MIGLVLSLLWVPFYSISAGMVIYDVRREYSSSSTYAKIVVGSYLLGVCSSVYAVVRVFA